VKQLSAIVASLLLLWMPFAPALASAAVSPSSACLQHAMEKADCGGCCDCGMPCCVKQSKSFPQPAPVVPPQNTGGQSQLSLIAWSLVILTLPENPAHNLSATSPLPVPATGAPLYERHCALLI
jgi:hypothetical protein